MYKQEKLGQATKEKFRSIVQLCRDDIKRASAYLEMTLAREVKGSKKSFF